MRKNEPTIEESLQEINSFLEIDDSSIELDVNIFARINEGADLLEKKLLWKELLSFLSLAVLVFLGIGIYFLINPDSLIILLGIAGLSTVFAIPFAISYIRGGISNE